MRPPWHTTSMKHILFVLLALSLPLGAGAQDLPPAAATDQPIEAAPLVSLAPPPVYGTCQTALAPTAKSYDEELTGVLRRYPGYFLFDEHTVNCDDKRVRFLVLFSRDGSQAAQVVSLDVSRFERPTL